VTTATTAWTNPPANEHDLIAWFHAMRKQSRVQEQPQRGQWHVFGYAEAKSVLTNHAAFSNAVSVALVPPDSPFMLFRAGNLSWMDPPRHQHLRELVRRVFTSSYVASLEPMIRATISEVLDSVAEEKDVAFVGQVASPIGTRVLANIVGIPVGDDQQFRSWAASLMALTDPEMTQNGMPQFVAETKKLHAYLHGHIAERRARPTDDLTSSLTQVEVEGMVLSNDEIAGLIALLMNTGVTSNQLFVNAMICMDQQPEAAARVRENPGLLPAFIEEASRFRGQTPRVERFSMEDVALGGSTIPAGRHVSVWLTAANHDPAQFPDPDTFDMSRNPNPHLGFGHGIHFCLGAALGRLQTVITFEQLLRLSSGLSVDYEQSRLLDPRLIFGAAELAVCVRWRNRR
jgi:cytochrome P450